MITRYQNIIKDLETRRDFIVTMLKKNPSQNLIDCKIEIEAAIRWLQIGQNNDIDPYAGVVKLPQTKTSTPSSEFRIIEDHESDNKQHWSEIEINGKTFRPTPGSIIIDSSLGN